MKSHPGRCVRKNFDRNGGVLCKGCFERDVVIDRLREEVKYLKGRVVSLEGQVAKKRVTRKDVNDAPHLPSSRKAFRSNSTAENRAKKGGATLGHRGHGRKSSDCDRVDDTIAPPDRCPCCDVRLAAKDIKIRTLVDVDCLQAKRRALGLKRGQCPKCKKIYRGAPPCLPKALYGNRLLSQAIAMHYLHGISIGRLLQIFGPEVTHGGLINCFHFFGRLCAPLRPLLINSIRREEVRNADETGWRTDGLSGFAWIFRSQGTTVFEHCDSRGSKVAREILGEEKLDGYLIVDRYSAYNRIPVKIQYCYAHLLREIEKLEKEFSGDEEVKLFVKRMCSLMGDAMNLQKMKLTHEQYAITAESIRIKIVREINQPYRHLGIRRIQQIFQKHKARMYHWAENPRVPPDNNRAEREIRATVIARKTSFGSQSVRGAQTRSNIMSVLYTVKKRLKENATVEDWVYKSLNKLSENRSKNLIDLIPPAPS